MSDQQSIVNPPSDENEIVKDEEVVHEALEENRITVEAAKGIDKIKDLQEEADKIELQNSLDTPPIINVEKTAQEEAIGAPVAVEKENDDEKDDAPPPAETQEEVVHEIIKETKEGSEAKSELAKELLNEKKENLGI